MLGPESGIFDEHLLLLRRSYRLLYTKFELSGIHVCDPSVNTASHHHSYDILGFCISILQFALAVGRFAQHAPELGQGDKFIKILVQDSISHSY